MRGSLAPMLLCKTFLFGGRALCTHTHTQCSVNGVLVVFIYHYLFIFRLFIYLFIEFILYLQGNFGD